MRTRSLPCLAALLLAMAANAAPVTVRDDAGNAVTLPQPAQRILSLAPHITELLFAAGGGDKIIGAVAYSDFPLAAKKLPRIGDSRQVDIERVIAMKPDLVVAWVHGGSERQINMLRELGIPIFRSEPTRLEGIADNIVRLGQLMGTDSVAQPAAADIRRRFSALAAQYATRPPVRMFYQVWDKPLYTLNGASIVSDAMRLCGGVNIFSGLAVTAPTVGIEAVLQADPEAIFGSSEKNDGGANLWRRFPGMQAVKRENLFTLKGELLNRAGPRMVAGTVDLCEKLDIARQRRGS